MVQKGAKGLEGKDCRGKDFWAPLPDGAGAEACPEPKSHAAKAGSLVSRRDEGMRRPRLAR